MMEPRGQSGVLTPAAFVGGMRAQVDQLSREKEELGREVTRCHEQLNLVFEVAGQLSASVDPDVIHDAFLHRFGVMLGAGAVFFDRDGCCRRIPLDRDGAALALRPECVRGVLASHIELERRRPDPLIAELSRDERDALSGAHVLLGSLRRPGIETGVVIALRLADEPAFDARDAVAANSVLSFVAQALNSICATRSLQQTAIETVCTLVNAIDAKDNYTAAHSERVGSFARLTGEALGLPKARLRMLEWAGLLHDVGKIGIPERILNKPGAFTPEEFGEMMRHPQIGHDVLRPMTQFEQVLNAVLCHHENHDGSGYPHGLCGEQIQLEARIIHVVDIFDALTTTRPYRQRFSFSEAIALLRQGAGTVTDPLITPAFIDRLHEYRAANPDEFRARFGHLLDPARWA